MIIEGEKLHTVKGILGKVYRTPLVSMTHSATKQQLGGGIILDSVSLGWRSIVCYYFLPFCVHILCFLDKDEQNIQLTQQIFLFYLFCF